MFVGSSLDSVLTYDNVTDSCNDSFIIIIWTMLALDQKVSWIKVTLSPTESDQWFVVHNDQTLPKGHKWTLTLQPSLVHSNKYTEIYGTWTWNYSLNRAVTVSPVVQTVSASGKKLFLGGRQCHWTGIPRGEGLLSQASVLALNAGHLGVAACTLLSTVIPGSFLFPYLVSFSPVWPSLLFFSPTSGRGGNSSGLLGGLIDGSLEGAKAFTPPT